MPGTLLAATDAGAPELRLAVAPGAEAVGEDFLLLYQRLVTGAGTPALQLMARSISLPVPDGGASGGDAGAGGDGGASGGDAGAGGGASTSDGGQRSSLHLRLGCDCSQTDAGIPALLVLLATLVSRRRRGARAARRGAPRPAGATS